MKEQLKSIGWQSVDRSIHVQRQGNPTLGSHPNVCNKCRTPLCHENVAYIMQSCTITCVHIYHICIPQYISYTYMCVHELQLVHVCICDHWLHALICIILYMIVHDVIDIFLRLYVKICNVNTRAYQYRCNRFISIFIMTLYEMLLKIKWTSFHIC